MEHSSRNPGAPDLSDSGESLLKNIALASTLEGVTISDCTRDDNPLIYANAGFERLTGYGSDEVLGRNCRFLQGDDTDPRAVAELRDAVRDGRECTVQLLNYRKDGTPFWNRLSITPVRDASGRLTNFIGIQSDVTAQKRVEEELRRATVELEQSNRRMQKDLASAAVVQRALLPQSLPEIENVRFAWAFRPCTELAGDILNVFRLDARHVAVYVLDVSGHGVAAALLAVTVSHLLSPVRGHSFLYRKPTGSGDSGIAEPAAVARTLNAYFQLDQKTRQYFTLIYGVLDIASSEFRYVSAGHPPPIHIRNGESVSMLEPHGPPIGMLPDSRYEQSRLELKAGDRLCLYTDGMIEAEDASGTPYGVERVVADLQANGAREPGETVDALIDGVVAWSRPASLIDDASVLILDRA